MRKKGELLKILGGALQGLGFNVSNCSFENVAEHEAAYLEMEKVFPQSEVTSFLRSFPDLFVTFGQIKDGAFHVRLTDEGGSIHQHIKRTYRQYMPSTVLLCSVSEADGILKFSWSWIDKEKHAGSLKEILAERFPKKIMQTNVDALLQKMKIAI